MPSLRRSRPALASLALVLAMGAGGCGSKGGTSNSGSITLSLSPTLGRVIIGGNTPVIATVTRVGGFSGAVNFTVTGAPAGVTGAVSNMQTSGTVTTATVTLTVDAATTLGTYNLVVHASGTGVTDATAPFTLTVDPLPGAYTLIFNNPSIAQGGTGVADITLFRQNFTGPVTLSVEALPAGITAVVNGPNPVTGTTSSLTISVAANVPLGTPVITVRGTSALDDVVKPLTIIVTAPTPTGNFALFTNPTPAISVVQGGNNSVQVFVLRTGGFTGGVTLSATGIPTGMIANFAPNPTLGNASLTLPASAGLAVGAYPIVIHGNFPGLAEQTVDLTVNVVAPGSTNSTVSVVGCSAAEKPVWAAVQNGSGAFQTVVPVGDVYHFTIDAGKGAFAYILRNGGTSSVHQMYMTQSEWAFGDISLCPGAAFTGTKVIDGTVAGLDAGDLAFVSLGGAQDLVINPLTAFHLAGALDGPHDQIGFKRAATGLGATTRGFLMRDQNPPDHTTTALYDFTSGASYAPATAAITVQGLGGGETVTQGMLYNTAATCDASTLYAGVTAGAAFTAYGVPVALQRARDRHGLITTGSLGPRTRTVIDYLNALVGHAVVLPSGMPAPTITEIGVGYSRRRFVATLPNDLQGSISVMMTQNGTQRSAVVSASSDYVAGTAVDLVLGDFTGLAGWDPSAAPSVGFPADFSITATTTNSTGTVCSQTSTQVRSSTLSGSN